MTNITNISSDNYISRHQIDMYIAYNKVLVESELVFSEEQTTEFSIALPIDAREIVSEVDNTEYPALVESNNLIFDLDRNKQIMYSYITDDVLEG
ncbi:TPA: hypothetical protein HA265_08100, partial [Candidatus Woesearchaeota archaeon]|nr:hypothetical protein [Candidatus Woesearchaeota archaeon]